MSDRRTDIKRLIHNVVKETDLSRAQARDAFDRIMSGDATPSQISSFITALRMKGETPQEIQGAAASMRQAARSVSYEGDGPLLDVVGTGGDEKHTFNVSTTSSFVAAGAGCTVAKHGNRSVSSKSGSADVLETLGINIETNAEENERLLNDVGMAFLFAPAHHPAMKHAIGPRREIGIRTIFNILGPITNPADADHYLLGAYSEELARKLADALSGLDTERSLVVHGSGYDEVALTGPTTVFHVSGADVEETRIEPEEFGFDRCEEEDLSVEGPDESARSMKGILDGTITGPRRSIIELNAGLAIYTTGSVKSMEEGVDQARESIRSGSAREKLEELKDRSQSFEGSS